MLIQRLFDKLKVPKLSQKRHLHGLKPINQPVNYYWQQTWATENLQAAFGWLGEQTKEDSDDVWNYHRQWATRKLELQRLLVMGKFKFQPVKLVEVETGQWHELRCAEDQLVIRAIAQVLNPVFQASLSPLFGAIYLVPLDKLGTSHGFYRHYMDDWIVMSSKKQPSRAVVKETYTVLQALKLRVHPDKTFIGKGEKGFDFLGFHCCPTGMRVPEAALSRRDEKLARLQGSSKKRIGQYLARWLGWATLFCDGVYASCGCWGCKWGKWRNLATI